MNDAIQPGSGKQADSSAPPKLNLRRLEKVQRIFQYSAAAVLLLFIGLIIYSSMKLYDIKQEIRVNDSVVRRQADIMAKNKDSIAKQEAYIEQLYTTNAGYQKAVDSIVRKYPQLSGIIQNTIENNISKTDSNKLIQPRVYIQIANNNQRRRATEVAELLRSEGFAVPGIENMEGKTRQWETSRIMFGKSTTVGSDTATIYKVFNSLSLPKPDIAAFAASLKVRQRHYEIWFGTDFTPPEPATVKPPTIVAVQDPPNTQTQTPLAAKFRTLVSDTRYTGEGYFSDIRNDKKETVATVHVKDVARSMDEATIYISAGDQKTADFKIKGNQPVVKLFNDSRYKVTITVTSFGKPRFVRIAYYDVKVEERIN